MSNHATSSSRILICNSKELTETSYKVIDFIRYCDHNKFKIEDESTVLLYVFVLLIFCILISYQMINFSRLNFSEDCQFFPKLEIRNFPCIKVVF